MTTNQVTDIRKIRGKYQCQQCKTWFASYETYADSSKHAANCPRVAELKQRRAYHNYHTSAESWRQYEGARYYTIDK